MQPNEKQRGRRETATRTGAWWSLIETTPMNTTATLLPAVEGQAILFPSWLEHYTEENRSGVARVSLAFNLMLTGGFGSAETFAAGYVTP